ncbi:small subunit processome component 20 homolog isoform X2 [Rhopilema esculentum]|uniref:small subunit processome component 20 homolog isoform X2 n=1 Tax=Rhopilema esculentum TaxID=499914 RepID=UPI0031CF8AF7
MYKAYLQLLMHRENEIQQHVYNCLKTYKFPYLKPYEEQFDKLLQDNTFKDALTLFAAGDEVEMVKKDHRNDVINILIRLLYGKLQRRSGLGVSGKSSQSARRNIIINFISCCPEEELTTFVNLITEPFKDSKKDSIHEVIPLRKQIGFLHMLHTILTRLSGLIVPHVDHLLKTLLDILEKCQMCLERRNQINSTFIGQLKSIRQLSISRITEFFEILPDFDFLPYVDMIFINAVMPQISRLHQESQQHPSPLLKLLYHWSTSPKYYEWLNKDLRCFHIKASSLQTEEAGALRETTVVPVSNDLQTETPLRFILKILGVKDKSETVVKMLMKMVQSIIQMKANGDDDDDAIEGVERGDNALRSSALKMIDGHIDNLLNHLFEAVKRKTGAQLSKIKAKDETFQAELSVLALISSFVTDPSQCQTVVSILFPTLKWIKNETDQVNTLITVKNLVKHCGNTRQIAVETMNLFMSLKERKPRTILCELFQVVFDSSEICCIIRDMNSWDKKFVDEPDFELRFQAFSRATSMLKAVDLSSKQIKPVLANCLYFSLEVQDMSLRDVSISFIIHMIDFIKASGSRVVVDDLLTGLLLPVVRKAVRSKNEIVRGEYTKILSRVVKHIDESSVSDMRILTNEDPEVDFFENVRHIQMHRRIRAVRHLAQLSKEGKLKQNSLYAFLLPLISNFIFDNVASKDHNLVTATIEAMGAIVHALPWQRYSHVLRNYLRLLPKEKAKKKIIIRVVVAVLDAFHFDMTMLSDDDIKPEKVNQKKVAEGIQDLDNGAIIKENENAVEDEDNEDEDEADMADNNHDQDCKKNESTSAMKIHKTILTTILPQLHKSLVKKSFVEDFHRKSRNKEIDDDAVLRVPIALAIIKLLQKLPKSTLHEQLPGVLLRVCQTLKSRAREVRETARETLVHIASSLGPEYFPYVLKEMKSTLQRGYQLHVLAFTLKSIFDALFDQLKPGDLDQSLASIIEVMMQDVFGNIAEEKEVEGITGKLHEAKTTKSYDSFEIVSQFVSPASLGNLLKSVRVLLETSHTHKVSNKAKEVLRRIGVGLQKNSSLSLTDLLVFIHQTLSGLQPVIMESNSKELRKEKEGEEFRRQDIYLVKKEPGRGQKIVEHDKKANLHLLGEFCLQLLHSFLKNQKLMPSNQEHIRMLDPYVTVLIQCLKSKYNRIIILAAKSMALLIRFPLPSLQTNTKTLATLLFKLLKNYARIGAGTGDNYELVLSTFKAMTVIIRDNKHYKVTEEQLKILLAFVEEDVYDYTRQATAFPLLKAILSRKLNAKEIVDVMKKVAELSVTSESDSVQLQCRQLMLQYLLDYPLGKNIEKHLQFYVSNLGYDIESGRRSALEMMAVLIKNFPEERINEYSSYFYFPLAMRLINDESALCRKLSNAVLKTLLQRTNAEKRTELLELTLKWLQQEKVSVQRLAMQIIGIFAEVEGAAFEKRLSAILQSINSAIKPSSYTAPDDYDDQSNEMKSKDQFLFNTLTALMKIFQNCDVIRKISFQESLTEIWGSIQAHLQYPHTWVRLVSSQLFGFLFASWPPSELVTFSREGAANRFYITDDLPSKVKLLCKDFCDQLKSENLSQEFGEQITKNLIYLIKLINLSSQDFKVANGADANSVEEKGGKGDGSASTLSTLRWLLNKLSNLASFEASQEQKAQIKRMCVFRCLAAVSIDLGKDGITPYISEILKPLHRELVSSSPESELYKLALEVIELIKEVVGKEVFAEIYAKVQRKVSEKKEFRKRKNAEEAVVAPEKFAKKKQKKNLQKRDQRKRKLIEKKPSLLKGNKRTKNQPI